MLCDMRSPLALLLCTAAALAEVHNNPGSPNPQPHSKYIHVVSEADSPLQPTYIKSKDGVYVASVIRKPKGEGRFPAIIMFHGAPGGAWHGAVDRLVARRPTADPPGSASCRKASSSSLPTTAAAT